MKRGRGSSLGVPTMPEPSQRYRTVGCNETRMTGKGGEGRGAVEDKGIRQESFEIPTSDPWICSSGLLGAFGMEGG